MKRLPWASPEWGACALTLVLSLGEQTLFQRLDGVLLPFTISLEFQNWRPGTAGLCPRPHGQSSGLSTAPLCFSLLPVGLRSSPRPGQCKPGLLAALTPVPHSTSRRTAHVPGCFPPGPRSQSCRCTCGWLLQAGFAFS